MPALLTKMSRGPKASAVLATAARSSSAEPLSALRDSALSPADSISRTSSRAFSGELKYVKATDAPSAASRRTMPAPIPREPPVTRATLPLNDFVCMWPPKPPGHPLCHIMDCSVQNEHSAGAAQIRANGWNDEIICIGNLCPAPGKTMGTRAWFLRLPRRDSSCEVGKCLRTSLLHLDEKPAPRAIAPKTCCRLAIPVSE